MTIGPRFGREELGHLVEALDAAGGESDVDALATAVGVRPGRAALAVTWLEEAGAAVVEPDGTVRATAVEGDVAQRAADAFAARDAVQRSRVAMVQDYADGPGCRRVRLLGYFGQEFEGPCGNCDRCDAGEGGDGPPPGEAEATDAADATDGDAFPVGAPVEHAEWGRGEVMTVEDDRLTVLFESAGYRTLSLELVSDGALLRRLPAGS
jgi:ATP-dependent DNA helicase RecQ